MRFFPSVRNLHHSLRILRRALPFSRSGIREFVLRAISVTVLKTIPLNKERDIVRQWLSVRCESDMEAGMRQHRGSHQILDQIFSGSSSAAGERARLMSY